MPLGKADFTPLHEYGAHLRILQLLVGLDELLIENPSSTLRRKKKRSYDKPIIQLVLTVFYTVKST